MTPTPSTPRTPTPALDAALGAWSLTDARDTDTPDGDRDWREEPAVDDATARTQTRRAVTLLAATGDPMTLTDLADTLAADTALSRPVWCDVVEEGIAALASADLAERTDTRVRWTGAARARATDTLGGDAPTP